MPDGLYERDVLKWAERQASLLGRLARGERVNADVDWPHVIEEVRDVGLSELRACQSLLQQAMAHLLKLHAMPDAPSATHWREEAGTFLDDAERRFAPSMRRRIGLDMLYTKAVRRAAEAGVTVVPDICPFPLDALLAGDVAALLALLPPSAG